MGGLSNLRIFQRVNREKNMIKVTESGYTSYFVKAMTLYEGEGQLTIPDHSEVKLDGTIIDASFPDGGGIRYSLNTWSVRYWGRAE